MPIFRCETEKLGKMNIEISKEDYEFLKELQNELNTQTNDGNANPVFWGVMEKVERAVPDGCGTTYIQCDDTTLTLEDAIEKVEDHLASMPEDEKIFFVGTFDGFGYTKTQRNLDEEWEAVDKESITEVFDFMELELKWNDIHLVDISEFDELSRYTGAFLTKRACQEYIDKFGYNHRKPRTYAMTAYRNFELERLLKILKNINL